MSIRLQLSKQFKCCADFNNNILNNYGVEYLNCMNENVDLKYLECKIYLDNKERHDAIEGLREAIFECIEPIFIWINNKIESIQAVFALWILGEEDK